MKRRQIHLAISVAVGATLSGLYLVFMYYSLVRGLLWPSSSLEALILGLQPIKLVVIVGTKELRRASPADILNLLSAEVLALPLLVGVLYVVHGPSPSQIIDSVIPALPIAEAAVFSPYTIFRFSAALRNGVRTSRVLVGVMAHFGILAYLAQGATVLTTGNGLANFTLQIASLLSRQGAPANGIWGTDLAVGIGGVVVYVAMITYAILDPVQTEVRLRQTVGFAFLGTAAVTLWIFVGSAALSSAFVTLMAPTLLVVLGIWWVTRA